MKTTFLAAIVFTLLCLGKSAAQASIIDFLDVDVLSGTANTYSDVTSGGFFFDALMNHSHLSKNTPYGGVANGTTLYTTDFGGGATYTTMTKVGGGTFTLNSLELAEHDRTGFGDASAVTITGSLFGGGTITQVVTLDGVKDGPGGVNDFQSVVLHWINLTSVRFEATAGIGVEGHGFSLDNIQVNEPVPPVVPEPASICLWGGIGLAGLIAGRRRKRMHLA